MPEDRVQMASRKKDGTPDQTEGYEIIGDKDAAIAATAEQLGQMAVSEADQANPPPSGNPDEKAGPTPEEQKRIDEHDALLAKGRADAEAEVNARLVQREAPVETAVRRSSRRSSTTEPTE